MAMMEDPEEARNRGLNPKAEFASSPFDSPQVSLELADGLRLTIHRSILLRCAKIGRQIDSSPKTIQAIDLQRFSSTAGHALVEYLYTSSYGLLKWVGDPFADLQLRELTARFETYALARTVELNGLERQVRRDIECTTRHLDIFTVIDAIKNAYPTPIGDDTWFPQWIKEFTKKAFKDPEELTRIMVRPDFGDDASVAKFLFKSMLESYVDVLKSVTGHDPASSSTDSVAAEADKTPASNRSFVNIGGSGVRDAFQGAAGAIPEPAPESAPELHPAPFPEEGPAPEPTPEPAEPGPLMPKDELSPDDVWGRFSAVNKKNKKDKRKALKAASVEVELQAGPETEPVPEPQAPESEPTPEQVHEVPPTKTGLYEGNGDADFVGGLRALHEEDGEHTCVAPRNPFDFLGKPSAKKKKKEKGGRLSPLPEPEAEVIKAVEIDDGRRALPEPSAMKPDDTTEVSRDAWGFWGVRKESWGVPKESWGVPKESWGVPKESWGVPKERRSPRVSIGS